MDILLEYWPIALFLPAILIGLGILVAIIRLTDRRR
jgi:hypothetical protein